MVTTMNQQKNKIRSSAALIVSLSLILMLSGCGKLTTIFGHQSPRDSIMENPTQLTSKELDSFKSGLKPVNGEIKAKYLMARHFQRLNRHLNAIEELNEVIKMEPYFPEAYNALGVSYDSLGKFAMAEECYKMALRLNPDLAYVVNNLGYSYMMQRKYENAVHFLEMAVAMEENNLKYRNNLMMASQATGYLGQKPYQDTASDQVEPEKTPEKIIEPESLMIASLETTSVAVAVDNKTTGNDPKEVIILKTHVAENQDNNELATSESLDPGILKPEPLQTVPLKPETINSDTIQSSKIIKKDDTNTSLKTTDMISRKQAPKVSSVAVEIELVNGNGISGFAKKTGKYLKEKGYRIRSLKNADHFNYQETRIYYHEGLKPEAELLADQLPCKNKVSVDNLVYHQHPFIKVLLGKDLVSDDKKNGQPYHLEISNGNGVTGAAKRLSQHLRAKGIITGRLTNADHFSHESSRIFYGKDQLSNAQALLESLPKESGAEPELVGTNANGSKIKLLLGKDMR
jgi:tetratricopeptide (TPR) repeat protein